MRNDEHEAERQRRRGKRDERRDRTAHGKADEDDEEIEVAADKIIDHADAHALEG